MLLIELILPLHIIYEGKINKDIRYLPLIFGCNHLGQYYLYPSFAGQKKQKPRHKERIRRLFLCSEVALRQHSSVGGEPCRSSLFVCFSGAAELVQLSALCAYNSHSDSPRT